MKNLIVIFLLTSLIALSCKKSDLGPDVSVRVDVDACTSATMDTTLTIVN